MLNPLFTRNETFSGKSIFILFIKVKSSSSIMFFLCFSTYNKTESVCVRTKH